MKRKKSILIFMGCLIAITLCTIDAAITEKHLINSLQERAEAYNVLENYILDVVLESDYFEECDSSKFDMYEKYSPEWMLAVVIDYNQYLKTNIK